MSTTAVLEIGVMGVDDTPASNDDARASSERLLLARLRRKDPDAFEQLVRQHQDRVFDFCVRMLSDREEAVELTQDIFLSVHQHVGTFRMDSRLSTWILRIAKNHCINRLKYLRRRGRGRSDVFEDVSEVALNDSAGAPTRPDELVEAARERVRVQRAIAQLDEDQRALVVLRDIEGLSYDEIVEITELAEGTVKSRLHRAREKLADILCQMDEDKTP